MASALPQGVDVRGHVATSGGVAGDMSQPELRSGSSAARMSPYLATAAAGEGATKSVPHRKLRRRHASVTQEPQVELAELRGGDAAAQIDAAHATVGVECDVGA